MASVGTVLDSPDSLLLEVVVSDLDSFCTRRFLREGRFDCIDCHTSGAMSADALWSHNVSNHFPLHIAVCLTGKALRAGMSTITDCKRRQAAERVKETRQEIRDEKSLAKIVTI